MITFLRFARLHTLIGTSISILVLFAMAGRHSGQFYYPSLGWTLLACLAANVYITGLNQLTDVAIDRINKPYLPLASGAYTMQTGRVIVLSCLAIALLTAVYFPPFLLATVYLSIALGTAYSLPPLRLKRFPFWAAFCILAVRGLIVNILLYLHFRSSLGGGVHIPASIWLLTALIFVFSIIIAWFKDLPDTEGDAAYQIRTLSISLGRQKVWQWGQALLGLSFFLVAVTNSWLTGRWLPPLSVALLLLLLALYWLGRGLRLDDQQSIARFYQGIWVLFFLTYGVFGVLGG